jgi:hypothetical protein
VMVVETVMAAMVVNSECCTLTESCRLTPLSFRPPVLPSFPFLLLYHFIPSLSSALPPPFLRFLPFSLPCFLTSCPSLPPDYGVRMDT